MSILGLDPGDPNNWYQSPQLGLFPVSPAVYGGGISDACYCTHSAHPHGSPSYPPPPPFPFQPSYSPPPPPPPPSQTIINGYVFPHQFPFPNPTYMSSNRPICSKAQSVVEPAYPDFRSFQPAYAMNPSIPTFQSPSVPTFLPHLQFPNPFPSFGVGSPTTPTTTTPAFGSPLSQPMFSSTPSQSLFGSSSSSTPISDIPEQNEVLNSKRAVPAIMDEPEELRQPLSVTVAEEVSLASLGQNRNAKRKHDDVLPSKGVDLAILDENLTAVQSLQDLTDEDSVDENDEPAPILVDALVDNNEPDGATYRQSPPQIGGAYWMSLRSVAIPASETLISTMKQLSVLGSDHLVSDNGFYKLGFFSPGSASNLGATTNRFLGIWYSKLPNHPDAIWVGNPESPINDSSAVFQLDSDGKLKIVYDGGLIYVSDVNQTVSGNVTLSLLGTGNVLWESFSNASNTLLPGMKLGRNLKTGENWTISSWLSDQSPVPGAFKLGVDPSGTDQLIVWRREEVYWSSGVWEDGNFQDALEFTKMDDLFWFTFVSSCEEKYFSYYLKNNLTLDVPENNTTISRWELNSWGQILQSILSVNGSIWETTTISPCIFNPKYPDAACIEEKTSECRNDFELFVPTNGYLNGTESTYSDNSTNLALSDCHANCWSDCTCMGYVAIYPNGSGCRYLSEGANFVQNDYFGVTYLLAIATKDGSTKKRWLIWCTIGVLVGVALLLASYLCYYHTRRRKLRLMQQTDTAKVETSQEHRLLELRFRTTGIEEIYRLKIGKRRGQEFKMFSLLTIILQALGLHHYYDSDFGDGSSVGNLLLYSEVHTSMEVDNGFLNGFSSYLGGTHSSTGPLDVVIVSKVLMFATYGVKEVLASHLFCMRNVTAPDRFVEALRSTEKGKAMMELYTYIGFHDFALISQSPTLAFELLFAKMKFIKVLCKNMFCKILNQVDPKDIIAMGATSQGHMLHDKVIAFSSQLNQANACTPLSNYGHGICLWVEILVLISRERKLSAKRLGSCVEMLFDKIMGLFLRVLVCRCANIHEEAMLAIETLAYAAGREFAIHMSEFYKYLKMGLKFFVEFQIGAVTVGVVGDIVGALKDKAKSHFDGIMTQLLKAYSPSSSTYSSSLGNLSTSTIELLSHIVFKECEWVVVKSVKNCYDNRHGEVAQFTRSSNRD